VPAEVDVGDGTADPWDVGLEDVPAFANGTTRIFLSGGLFAAGDKPGERSGVTRDIDPLASFPIKALGGGMTTVPERPLDSWLGNVGTEVGEAFGSIFASIPGRESEAVSVFVWLFPVHRFPAGSLVPSGLLSCPAVADGEEGANDAEGLNGAIFISGRGIDAEAASDLEPF
jgi:hypothetical protein